MIPRTDIEHDMTVGTLKQLLTHLDDDLILIPNIVRNLMIAKGDISKRDGTWEYVGFIDFLNGKAHIEYDEGENVYP